MTCIAGALLRLDEVRRVIERLEGKSMYIIVCVENIAHLSRVYVHVQLRSR
jgi:hypothetical protein